MSTLSAVAEGRIQLTPARVIRRMRGFFDHAPERWGAGMYAQTYNGRACRVTAAQASCWCALGAMAVVTGRREDEVGMHESAADGSACRLLRETKPMLPRYTMPDDEVAEINDTIFRHARDYGHDPFTLFRAWLDRAQEIADEREREA